MFKLFKDLTRPPEPLSPRPAVQDTSPISTPYAARQARGTPPHAVPGSSGVAGTVPAPTLAAAAAAKAEAEETDEHARTVVELLHKLEAPGDMMHYVEVSLSLSMVYGANEQTLSQLNVVPQTKAATRAFKRHRGFPTLIRVFGSGFSWKPRPQGESEEWEVKDVQRMEGIRIGLETLGWALGDHENRKVFDVSCCSQYSSS